MNGNAELLNYVYQNSQMGVKTVEHLLEIVEDGEFRKQLTHELGEYQSISAAAQEYLDRHDYEEKDLPAMQKLSAGLMIDMKTLTDKSPSHVAEMMIIGSNMGVIDAIKNIRKYSEAEKEILDLMKRLLEMEENNIRDLKKFL